MKTRFILKFLCFLIKIKYYLIFISVISFIFILTNCKTNNIKLNLSDVEQILLNKTLLNSIKINKKIVLLDLTNDIKKYKKANEATDDFLGSDNYIYNKEEIDKLIQYIDYFYENIKKKLEEKFKEEKLNFEIIFKDTNNDELGKTTIYIEIEEYYEGEYNLIKNEATKFKISVKLFRKDLLNNNILLFIKNYKCKPSILLPIEKSRIIEVANLCSRDIIKFFKTNIK